MKVRVYHAELGEAQAHPRLQRLMTRANGNQANGEQSSAGGPFDRADWLALLARECLAPARPLLAVAQDDQSILALPLIARPPGTPVGLAACANWYSFWAGPLHDDPERAPALLTALARVLAPHGLLDFAPLSTADARLLARAFRSAGWLTEVSPAHTNRFLRLDGHSFDQWWAQRPGALRATVRRKQARVSCRIATTFDSADWAAYEAIYAASWKPSEASPAFLRAFAQAESQAGGLRLGLAEVDGEPVAAQFWTVEAGRAFIHKLAHRDDARDASPGTVLTHAMMHHVITRDGVSEVDFGTGDDPYKADWMDQTRPRWRLRACHPGVRRAWPALPRTLARLATGRSRLAPPAIDD